LRLRSCGSEIPADRASRDGPSAERIHTARGSGFRNEPISNVYDGECASPVCVSSERASSERVASDIGGARAARA